MSKLNLPKIKAPVQPKVGEWILWRWIGDKTFSESRVQEIKETQAGALLELTDTDFWSKYPNRILRKEIYIIKSFLK